MYFDPKIDETGMEIVCEVATCGRTATHPEQYDAMFDDRDLCPDHMEEEYEELRAEAAVDRYLDARAADEQFMNTGSPYRVW